MLNIKKILTTFLVSFILSGCATLSTPEEPIAAPKAPKKITWTANKCQSTNWYELGVEQGEQRYTDIDIKKVATTCVQEGVDIPTSEYLRGLEEQAKSYCTLHQGYQMGLEGQEYPTVCRKEVYSEFYYEWYRGAEDYCKQKAATGQLATRVCETITT